MTFDELCRQLPQCPGPGGLPIIQVPGGFTYIQRGLPEFVGPDLSPRQDINQPKTPSIIIISAAGAVGKSTLAREMASCKCAPIWDLAAATAVGGHSAEGQLLSSFGFGTIAEVNRLLTTGDLFLIIDALDEARVKANEAGYEAFVADLAAMAKHAVGTTFVLLGRTQAAETTWLLLEDAGVSVALLSIEPFTRSQAERYVELRIRSLDERAAKRITDHWQPFVEARDLIFNHLERAVGGGDGTLSQSSVREFLGYAPVLETVAVLLAKETNYADFTANLGDHLKSHPARQIERPLDVLHHVVTRLLEREQSEKLVSNIRPALEPLAAVSGWSDWNRLYSPAEQRLRLLGCVLKCDFQGAPNMPPALRAQYEEQLKTWLPEHPFLREGAEPANKVFESYLFATWLREHLTDMSKEVEKRVSASDYRPSRLLADFYVLLGEQGESDAIPARHIGLLYDALLAGETESLRIRLSVEAGDPDDEEDVGGVGGEGEFELAYAAADEDGEEQSESRTFKNIDNNGLITFRRQLKDAHIVTRGAVSLGGDVDDFEIGPSVDVRCGRLEIHSLGLVVQSGTTRNSGTDAVILEAVECSYSVTRRPLVRGALHVSWPGAEAYPWSEYAAAPRGAEDTDRRMHATYRRFRRIVTTLRSHSKGSLARLRDKVEHSRILQGKLGEALLQDLLDEKVLVVKGKFFHWEPKRADDLLKISYDDLRRRRASPVFSAYLRDFIANHAELYD